MATGLLALRGDGFDDRQVNVNTSPGCMKFRMLSSGK
jgi:hypothetical protein